jgi:hypothetical protein
MNAEKIFDILWEQYAEINPSVVKIHNLFESEKETIINDHVAFRTFNDPRVNIEVLARPFLAAGYKEAGEYHFPAKKLFAKHYEMSGFPRVFISELMLEQFSEKLQADVRRLIDSADHEVLKSDQLIFSGRLFGKIPYQLYERLREESEYAAWVCAYGYRANHFTVSINHLKKFQTIYQLNEFLKTNGFKLNSSGGEVKGTPEQLLEQSSTLADRVTLEFTDGLREIPSCYYEFALRYPDKNGTIFSGFIAESADKIFESTNFRK